MDEQRKSATNPERNGTRQKRKDLENAWNAMSSEEKKKYNDLAMKSKRSSSVYQLNRLVKGCARNGYPVEMVVLDEIQQVKVRQPPSSWHGRFKKCTRMTLQRNKTKNGKKM